MDQDEATKYITAGFDTELDSEGGSAEFQELLKKHGFQVIGELARKIDYPRVEQLADHTIKMALDTVSTMEIPKAEYLFGCRDPSTRPNEWHGAYVVGKSVGSSLITCALFDNGSDYVSNPATYAKAVECYDEYIKKGWIPMSNDDLEKTSGIKIDSDTLTKPIVLF